jgi:hypothetical protein
LYTNLFFLFAIFLLVTAEEEMYRSTLDFGYGMETTEGYD